MIRWILMTAAVMLQFLAFRLKQCEGGSDNV